MSKYSYSRLSPDPYTIRLLRILPDNGISENVRCELFEYTLRMMHTAVHPYEALSYAWGDKENPRSVIVNGQTFYVTDNLYAALLRLRDHSLARIIWADAICIDQENQEEKQGQIQLMAAIYAKASRVIVWLGETEDGSVRALEAIRRVSEKPTTDPNPHQREIQRLLERKWFRRIWVSE